MLDYMTYPCPHCQAHTLVYLQPIMDCKCESCGKWETPDDE